MPQSRQVGSMQIYGAPYSLGKSHRRVVVVCVVWVSLSIWAPLHVYCQIPSTAGQVWKTYDISPFVKVAGLGSEEHVVHWILQQTGYEQWHGKHAASLSASGAKLSCYHTPDMQTKVAEVVERFTADVALPHRFQIRVIGIGSVRWRQQASETMTAMPTATAGVQAWVVPRENSAELISRLLARNDVEELPVGPVFAANGVPATLSGVRERSYIQDITINSSLPNGWQPLSATCREGLSVDVQPLVSLDGELVDMVLRCRIDQIERMASVSVAVPVGNRPDVKLEVPQISAVRIGERFRWPVSRTLVIGLGLVPWPVPGQNKAASAGLFTEIKRSDAIVVIEPRLRNKVPQQSAMPPSDLGWMESLSYCSLSRRHQHSD
ncbi:MAG: hypothetical protein HON07_09150 [Planctomycetaceae bacterium]|nr:hypothetical protein [Planctomycetaceae bacterium]